MTPPHSPLSLPVVATEPEVPLYAGDMATDLRLVSRNRLAETLTGGLARPSKMPCPSWGISAARCRVGAVLARREGTVCHSCYATRGRFRMNSSQEKLELAYRGLIDPRNLWTPSMAFLIRWQCADRFRWFHSGDLAGEAHLRNIIRVCLETPDVLHWLPTREAAVVTACKDDIPDNLVIRASGTDIDGPAPRWWPLTSTVVTAGGDDEVCPASHGGGDCDDHGCVACWDPEVPNVTYRLH